MNLKEVSELIQIRDYLVACVNNMNLDRVSLNSMNKLLPLVDKKIISILLAPDFKELLHIPTFE
jgi:hypothetical protein